MKKKSNCITYIMAGILVISLLPSCAYEYLTEDGIHNPKVNMTTYDYLRTERFSNFDTLVMLIDNLGMKEEVNAAGTVLAITDYSIGRSMRANWTLDSLFTYTTRDSLRNYLFDPVTTLESLDVESNIIESKGGKRFDLHKELQTQFQYTQWTTQPVYRLRVFRIVGESDFEMGIPIDQIPVNERDRSNYVQTSNISTTTGTVHILENLHYLNFNFQ
ncbi:hypothetical protein ACFSKL_09405 [Belliella marina]|uniref:Fasciclin domain-containing protein n=1 Tax=Belliella marina TaxID=1644146 RepID=A0ABW4VNA0_9BACT